MKQSSSLSKAQGIECDKNSIDHAHVFSSSASKFVKLNSLENKVVLKNFKKLSFFHRIPLNFYKEFPFFEVRIWISE